MTCVVALGHRYRPMRSKSRTLRAAMAALLAILLMTSGGAWALCVGEEGHTALETLGADCCAGAAASGIAGPGYVERTDCGTCVDVPISHAELRTTPSSAPTLAVCDGVAAAPELDTLGSTEHTRSTPDPIRPHKVLNSPILRC